MLVGRDAPRVRPRLKSAPTTPMGGGVKRVNARLRYIDVGDIDAGLNQIRSGFAIARDDSRDGYGYHPREGLYI